jgi:predicted nucleotidyltransferase
MTDIVKNELEKIVSTLTDTGIVTKIILFGSHARGEETRDSDLDLCVLTSIEDNGRPFTDIAVNLRAKLIDVQERSLDFLAYNQDDFFACAERPRSFERHIRENGVVIYGACRGNNLYIGG